MFQDDLDTDQTVVAEVEDGQDSLPIVPIKGGDTVKINIESPHHFHYIL